MSAAFPFTPELEDQIEAILFGSLCMDGAADLFCWHGLACALASSEASPALNRPESAAQTGAGSPSDLFSHFESLLIGESVAQLSGQELQFLTSQFAALIKHVGRMLESDEDNILPSQILEDEDALQSWCQGYAAGVYSREASWFEGSAADEIAQLLLPILAFSGLHEDDAELTAMIADDEVAGKLLEQLDTIVSDLYLLMQESS